MARFRVPHTLILLFAMNVVALLLTYVLPQGEFERVTNEEGRQQVVAGTYHHLEDAERPNPLSLFSAIPRGMAEAQDIIFFLFLVGGSFAVLRATGAVDALLGFLLDFLGKRSFLLVAGGMLTFAVGSSTIGMAEEYIPFVPVLLALAIGLGFDAITAIGILCIGYGIGYGMAIFNPFTVLIAQRVAEVQPASGLEYRLALYLPFLAVGIHHVWSYAKTVKADPSASLVADIEPDPAWKVEGHPAFTRIHVLVIAIVIAAIGVIVWGLTDWGWYVVEMGAVFLALAVVLAVIARMSPDDTAKAFCTGAAELTTTALLIGFARSILVILEDGRVIDTIVHGVSLPLQGVGSALAAVGMLFFQSICNLFIPSGSGQAYVTMPVMAPLGDLVGVNRQVAVLAYQMGDGLTNILVPTNAVLIAILTMARIPYERWLRFVLPFMVKAWILGSVALAVAVMIGWS
ncbi:MAG: AbgT family transporter [Holophagales bacterium]|nr:AbgT family transporter [Holophagales bacterium]